LIVTVFRTRLRSENEAEYREWAARIHALAETMPGFISHKTFQADDGERVTIVEFESEEAQAAWRNHPEHSKAQRLGREKFYSEYELKVCELKRVSSNKAVDR
jgi:heme-degrading monooxygenase HmoA